MTSPIYIDGNAPTGLCYGKLEAGILTFVIPGLLLGHLVNQKGTPPQTVGSCSCLAPFRQGTPPQTVALNLTLSVVACAVWFNG